jgi:hypothetical protein
VVARFWSPAVGATLVVARFNNAILSVMKLSGLLNPES